MPVQGQTCIYELSSHRPGQESGSGNKSENCHLPLSIGPFTGSRSHLTQPSSIVRRGRERKGKGGASQVSETSFQREGNTICKANGWIKTKISARTTCSEERVRVTFPLNARSYAADFGISCCKPGRGPWLIFSNGQRNLICVIVYRLWTCSGVYCFP